jgi:hypothetical protein
VQDRPCYAHGIHSSLTHNIPSCHELECTFPKSLAHLTTTPYACECSGEIKRCNADGFNGISGMGDGSVAAALEPRPTDLTHLRERYTEASPLRHPIAAIAGCQLVRTHGNSAMPVWGEIIEREMKERKIGWPHATTIQRERPIVESVMTLQQ